MYLFFFTTPYLEFFKLEDWEIRLTVPIISNLEDQELSAAEMGGPPPELKIQDSDLRTQNIRRGRDAQERGRSASATTQPGAHTALKEPQYIPTAVPRNTSMPLR